MLACVLAYRGQLGTSSKRLHSSVAARDCIERTIVHVSLCVQVKACGGSQAASSAPVTWMCGSLLSPMNSVLVMLREVR